MSSYNGTCPLNYPDYQEPPICGVDAGAGKFNVNVSTDGLNDFGQARALGLTIVRLCLSWSEIEPTPGTRPRRNRARFCVGVRHAGAQPSCVGVLLGTQGVQLRLCV